MNKDHNLNTENETTNLNEDAIMNRVNQTFDKLSQDVKEMIDENQQNNMSWKRKGASSLLVKFLFLYTQWNIPASNKNND